MSRFYYYTKLYSFAKYKTVNMYIQNTYKSIYTFKETDTYYF